MNRVGFLCKAQALSWNFFFFSGWVLLVLLYSFLVGYARLGPMSLQDSELSGELGRTAFAGSIR